MKPELEQIKAALRLTLELSAEANIQIVETMKQHISFDSGEWLDVETAAKAAFIAHACTFAPAQARLALTAIEGLEKVAWVDKERSERDGSFAGTLALKALSTICRDWPKESK